MPPESSCGYDFSNPLSPTVSMNSSTSCLCSLYTWRALSPSEMLSRMLSHGKSVACWNAKPRSAPGFVIFLPSTNTPPEVGSASPAICLKSVVFPQPDGPIRLTKLPAGMSRLTPFSAATVSPSLLINVFTRLSMWIAPFTFSIFSATISKFPFANSRFYRAI